MAVLSVMRAPARQAATRALLSLRSPISQLGSTRSGGHGRIMIIRPSQYYLRVMKDIFHFYFMLGAIPYGLIILYANMFIGPAVLAEIPEGYIPRHWEFYRHPLTRFWSKYIHGDWAVDYEMKLMDYNNDGELMLIGAVDNQIRSIMKVNQDYKSWFYTPVYAKNFRYIRSRYQEWNLERFGDDNRIRQPQWSGFDEDKYMDIKPDPHPIR